MLFFDKDIGLELIRKNIKERLLSIPRFRSRYDVKQGAFIEMDVEDIDFDYHLVLEKDIVDIETIRNDYIGNAYKYFDFNPDKPLWQFIYFPRIADGRTVLLTRIAHTIGDGVSQVGLLSTRSECSF